MGTLVDISYSGALLDKTTQRPEIGTPLRLYITFPPAKSFELVGRVVRHTESGFAVEYDTRNDPAICSLVDDAAAIDAATLGGITLTRSGGDGTFESPNATTDFRTNGAVVMQFRATATGPSGEGIRLDFIESDLGPTTGPQLTAAGMKTAQAEVLASSYASLLTDRIATKDDLKALEDRLNARIAYAQVAAVVALISSIVRNAARNRGLGPGARRSGEVHHGAADHGTFAQPVQTLVHLLQLELGTDDRADAALTEIGRAHV